MTSGQMENAYWKKLQNDSTVQLPSSEMLGPDGKMLNGNNQFFVQSLDQQKHQQTNQKQQKVNLGELMSQSQMNNMSALQNLNEMLMQTNKMNTDQNPNRASFGQPKINPIREVGAIDKILNGYGFIKSLNRENGLFFQYNNMQNMFKVGDIVEFNESVDKNNKPIAINLVKVQSNDTKMPQNQSQVNLKDLLLNPPQKQTYNQQQQNYENFLNDLKQFKIQQQAQENQNLNSLISLINKENLFNSQNFQANLTNQQSNILNMAKMGGVHQSSSMSDFKNLCSEFIEGNIAIPANLQQSQFNAEGRITYQRNGETFYIPYLYSDLMQPNIQLRPGDRIKFCITQRNVNNMVTLYASRVELIEPLSNNLINTLNNQMRRQPNQKYRGIISWLKDSFGKIEREDQSKETFFHFTDYNGEKPMKDLRIGSNVEFEIQDRYGKEIAVNITNLPDGSISFDELSRNILIGRVIAAPLMNSVGRLIYEGTSNENLIELTFTDRDRIPEGSEYTFLEGDFVQFRIATDKRKRLSPNVFQQQDKRATQLTLIEEYSLVENSINTNEHRERGILAKISNDKYGAIKCLEKDDLIYFSFNEIVNFIKLVPDSVTYKINKTKLEVGDSLEFSVVQCQRDQVFTNGLKAIRIVKLSKNSVQFEIVSSETYTGWIEKEASLSEYGSIKYEISAQRFDNILYKLTESDQSENTKSKKQTKNMFNKGDRVQFNILDCVKSKKQFATNIKLGEQRKQIGYVTMLKDNYGFIELNLFDDVNMAKNTKASRDIFFHYSSYQDNINDLEIGDEVDFVINRKNKQKYSAENVAKVSNKSPKVTITPLPGVLKGKIVQALRSHSSGNDQSEYYGKIQLMSDSNKKEPSYQFGIFSLSDRKLILQVGDIVSFQLVETPDNSKKAYNILLVQQAQTDQVQVDKQAAARGKEAKKGKIESIKGHCGQIEYTVGAETKKIFFHISDFVEPKNPDLSDIKTGDEVEFQTSHRNGKFSAVKIKRIGTSVMPVVTSDVQTEQRPDRLLTKLKAANIDNESGKQLILTRGPINPDGKLKSFSKQLKERLPGSIVLVNENES